MGRLTHTVSGSIATVRSPAVAPIESLKVHFSPIQEGTGDPSPSNIRPITGWTGVNTTKVRNIWDGRYEKGYINASGQVVSSNDTFVNVGYIDAIPNSKIKFRFTRTNTSAANIHLFYYNENKEYITDRWIGPDGDINISANTRYIRFQMDTAYSATYDGKDLSVYYSDEAETIPVTFPAVGKNLFPIEIGNEIFVNNGSATHSENDGKLIITTNASSGASGVYTKSTSEIKKVYDIIEPPFTISMDIVASETGNVRIVVCGSQQVFEVGASKQRISVTATSKATINFNIYGVNNGATLTVSDLQIEKGSSATAYEPYTNTAYGGYVDLATGNIIKEYGIRQITGYESNITWQNYNNQVIYTSDTVLPGIYKDGSSEYIYGFCNLAKQYNGHLSSVSTNNNSDGQGIGFSNLISVWGVEEISVEAVINMLKSFTDNGNPLTIIYKLATPQLITTLTPQEIKTFKGYSNFWSNAGDVDVTYQVVESSEMTKERQKIFAGNAPTIHTVSGSVANFEMEPGLNRNLKSCKVGFLPVQEGSGDPFPPINQNGSIVGVNNTHNESELSSFKIHFSPIQSGSGDPSPTNIRPITGWTGVTGYKSGKNLYSAGDQTFTQSRRVQIGQMIKPGTYTLSLEATSDDIDDSTCLVYLYNGAESTGISKRFARDSRNSWTFTIDVEFDCLYLYASQKWVDAEGDTATFSNIQLEVGSVATSYEPYSSPTSYPVSWESQGTVYGGYVDLVSGEVVAKYGSVDLGTLNWFLRNYNDNYWFYSDNIQRMKTISTTSELGNIISDRFLNVQAADIYHGRTGDNVIGQDSQVKRVRIKSSMYDNNTVTFRSAMDGVLLYYELETPIVVTALTPTQIALVTGKSSYWSNADSVTVETAGNVRPINGWRGVNTYNNKKNLLNVDRPYGTPDPTTLLVPTRIMDVEHCYVGSHPDGYYVSYYSSGSVSNGVITVSSFPNNSYGLGFPVPIKGGEKYTFNVTSSNDRVLIGTSYYDRDWKFIKNGGDIYQNMLPNKILTTPDNAAYILIIFRSATNETYTYTNASFELGENGTSYEPYSGNIYSVEFPLQGKNLFDEKYPNMSENTTNVYYRHYYVGDGNVIASSDIPLSSSLYGNLFMLPGKVTTGVSTDINDILMGRSRVITPVDGYITIAYRNHSNADPRKYHVMIERAAEGQTTPSKYEPMQTLCGGYVNLVTGEVWKTHQFIENSTKVNNYTERADGFWYTTSYELEIPNISDANSGFACDRCKVIANVSGDGSDGEISFYANGIIRWREYRGVMDLTQYKQYLADHPLRFVYELATPQLVTTLTPTQIQALKGTNNILSDANGIIEVKYWSH